MKKILFVVGVLWCLIGQAADLEGNGVLLRSVDKVTGRTLTTEATIGVPVEIGSLQVNVLRCLKKPPEETPENAAFLVIEESDKNGVSEVVFKGWMFSSNPALSAMEHPVFDIWVLSCLVPEEPAHDDGDVFQRMPLPDLEELDGSDET